MVYEERLEAYTTDGLDLHAKRLNGRLQEIAAEKARRGAEKKTVGQRVAEDLVYLAESDKVFPGRFGNNDASFVPADKELTIRYARRAIAAAIDKVRADTIEECAKKVDQTCVCTDVGRRVLDAAMHNVRDLK